MSTKNALVPSPADPINNSKPLSHEFPAPQSLDSSDGHFVSGVQVWECLTRDSVPADVERLHEHINVNTSYLQKDKSFLRGTLLATSHPDSVKRLVRDILLQEQRGGAYFVIRLMTWEEAATDPNAV